MTIEGLIAALEKATGDDRELDEEIMLAAYPDLGLRRGFGDNWYSSSGIHVRVEPYTASLDAARSLLTSDQFWRLQVDPGHTTEVYAVASVLSDGGMWHTSRLIGKRGEIEARALTAAAIKARVAAQLVPNSGSRIVPQTAQDCPKTVVKESLTTGQPIEIQGSDGGRDRD